MSLLQLMARNISFQSNKQENNMSDKWHEMLDHLVNKNEDKAKEVFKNIMDTEKDNIMAQDAIEPEVVSTDAPIEDTPAE